MGPRQWSQGERARSHFRGGAGGLRQGALISLSVELASPADADLAISWTALFEDQLAGRDPTGPWRATLAEVTSAQYALPAPPAMVGAFVLQWCLQVPADVAWVAAERGWGVVDPLASGLSFQLAAGYPYPVRARVRATSADFPDVATALERSRAAYLDAGRRFAASYAPGVRLGPHQRRAMVDDVWQLAGEDAEGRRPGPRASCCFIYALPGVHECAGCPRLRRPQGRTGGG